MKSWFKEFRNKYKIVIIHPETYEEHGNFHTSKMSLFSWIFLYSLILVAITTCVIFFTSVRELIPGYTDVNLDRRVYNIENRADSIEEVFRKQDQYIENLKRIINNEDIDIDISYEKAHFNTECPAFTDRNFGMPTFFVPVNGLVTNHFNSKNKHFGVDVVSKVDAVIKASADGTIVFADWSVEGGYVIGIQHNTDIITIYKHNASLLCSEGDVVKAGDAIAIVGGGGSTSTGPHLHFEIWFNGKALNPEDYISFEEI